MGTGCDARRPRGKWTTHQGIGGNVIPPGPSVLPPDVGEPLAPRNPQNTMRQRWHGSDRNVVGGCVHDRVGGGCWVVVVRLLGVHQDTVDVAVEV